MRCGAANFARCEIWWPARVTRPVLRIKSPLHHFNACRPNKLARRAEVRRAKAGLPSRSCRRRLACRAVAAGEGWCSRVLAARVALALATFSTSCLFWLDYASVIHTSGWSLSPTRSPPMREAARATSRSEV